MVCNNRVVSTNAQRYFVRKRADSMLAWGVVLVILSLAPIVLSDGWDKVNAAQVLAFWVLRVAGGVAWMYGCVPHVRFKRTVALVGIGRPFWYCWMDRNSLVARQEANCASR